jgi:hypothetical protein
MCRWDGAGYACPNCDDFVKRIHRIIDDGIVEQRRDLNPTEWDLFSRRDYYRAYAAKRRRAERMRMQMA